MCHHLALSAESQRVEELKVLEVRLARPVLDSKVCLIYRNLHILIAALALRQHLLDI